ncbi:flagellar filament capping protein FliD [Pseudomonas sp. EL_65y_Pfl2_R96]|uniref:flagellar filament capping protein FliD n=1 Tax=Pseudomonas sp. EL_65y_Pfl2_R96 TaxID=3088699 RepID=UPI0030D97D1E
MASPITTSTGLGSGLDVSSIVTALVNADKSAKQTQINTQTTLNTAKISAVGSLKSALTTFQTAMTTLKSTTTPAFSGFAATSSATSVLTATSDNTAVNGSYSVTVKNLATSSKVASASFAGGATSAIPSGTLKISQNGTDYDVTIPSGATLQSTRDAINTTLQTKGITANIVTDTNGSRLVIGSTTTGAGSDISVSGIAGLEIDGSTKMDGTTTSAGYIGSLAADATVEIDGLTVTSASNTISQAVGGLNMTLVAASTTPVTVTVANNTAGLKTSLQSFIDAYNGLITSINTLTKATEDSDGNLTVAAALTGDSMPRSLIAAVRNELVAPGAGSSLSVLAQLGIRTSQSDGTLSLDSTKFTAAMDKGLGGEIQTLFNGTDSTNGLISRMSAAIEPYTKAGDGILAQRSTNLSKQKSDLADQQDALDLRITNLTAMLTAKYNAMDLLVGQMKATATSITSFFDTLNAQQSNS